MTSFDIAGNVIKWFENWGFTQTVVVSGVVSLLVTLSSQIIVPFLGNLDYV